MNIAYPDSGTTAVFGDSSGTDAIGNVTSGTRGFLRHLWRLDSGRLYYVDRYGVNVFLYYSDDDGVTWSAGQQADALTWTAIAAVDSCVDSTGNVHIVWAGTISGATKVYYRVWDGDAFEDANEAIVTGALTDIEARCSVAVNEDDVVAVFFQQWDAGPNRDIFATIFPFSSWEGFTPGAQFDFSAEGLGQDFEVLCCLTSGADRLEHHRYTNATDTWSQITADYFGSVMTVAGDWSVLSLDDVLYVAALTIAGTLLFRSYTVAGGLGTNESVKTGGGTEINVGTDSAGGIYVTSYDDGLVEGYLYQRQSGPTWVLIDTRTDQIWAMPDVGAYKAVVITPSEDLGAAGTIHFKTPTELLSQQQFTSPIGTQCGVTRTSALLLSTNNNRKWACIINNSDTAVFLALGSHATAGDGIRLGTENGERAFQLDWTKLYMGEIWAKHNRVGTKKVTVSEGV